MVQGYRLQAILNHGTGPDQADTVGNQSTQIAHARIGNPYARKPIVAGADPSKCRASRRSVFVFLTTTISSA
jgi:hypothetical protein